MEPPFYYDLNTACMTMDQSKLSTLGPFAMAIFNVFKNCKTLDEKRDDSLEKGEHFEYEVDLIDDDLGLMRRSFLLFRGALMNTEWINDWK